MVLLNRWVLAEMVNVISRTKASSHPSPMGGIYVGVVKTVASDGKVFVSIPKLGNTIGPLRVANSNINRPLSAGMQVLCAYTSMANDEMYVLGYVNPIDIFTPTITSPADGDVIHYNGTNWVNKQIDEIDQLRDHLVSIYMDAG